ncbi:MAG: prolyl oligopeptidase family serine peptidase [Ahrensia sp.]|nr:prolyl oligopeptidase family serine peptidase [Ahrensia sp.]
MVDRTGVLLIQRKRIAVMGGSYGGYSAAIAMTRDPGLFVAGIIDFADRGSLSDGK